MAVAYTLIGLVAAIYCLYLYFTRTFNYWRDRNVPGPTPVPFFGTIMESATRRKNLMFVMKKIYDDYPDEKLVGVYQMTTPNLLIRDPDLVKRVMMNDFDHFVGRGVEFSKDGLGLNLFHADNKTWRILRDKFTPVFTSGKIRNMFYLITERGDNFITYVEDITRMQPEQEVYEIVENFTLATIAACAFGLDINLTTKSNTIDALKRINEKLLSLSFGFELDLMYPGILSKLGASLFPAEVTKFFNDLVNDVMAARNGVPTNRRDFMDLILEMKQANKVHGKKRVEGQENESLEITQDIMAAQAFLFYTAGYDSTATAMAYMLYHLALNPDIQDKVAEEIKEVLKRHGGVITYDALMDLVYLDRVFHETLRMHPVGDPLKRVATFDYDIRGTGITLKKGQPILVSIYGLHNDEKYWPDPWRFDPDRFNPENSANRHPGVYLPFGIGPKNCIGTRFAKITSRMCMAKLLQRFRVEPTEHTRREFRYDTYRLTVYPIGGIKMIFLPRS